MRTLCTIFILATVAGAQENPFAQAIQQGQQLFEKGEYEEAAAAFARARELVPQAWQGHAFQSMAHVEQARREPDLKRRAGLVRQAEAVASDLVKRTGVGFTDPFYRFLLGMARMADGDIARSFDLLLKASTAPRARYARYAGFPLQYNAQRGLVQAALHYSTQMVMNGKFEEADTILTTAEPHLAESNPNRAAFHRALGVVSEQLGRYPKAIKNLRLCIEISGDEKVRDELLSAIAMMLLETERQDEGEKVLAEIPAESKHPQVLAARAMALYKEAMREPDGPKMEKALAYHRKVMKDFPPDDVYYLVEQWGDLVLEKVSQATADANRELLLGTLKLIESEVRKRPECPSLYFKLYRLHKLLGNKEEEARYQRLHKRKKKDWTNKIKFNAQGKPRCRAA